jgi:putative DNA primase/helicase
VLAQGNYQQHDEEESYAYQVLPEVPDLTHYRLNDAGNAQRLIAMFGRDMHYSPELRAWLLWDGSRWKLDSNNTAQRMAKEAMKEFLWQAGDMPNKDMLRFAERSLDLPRLRHMLEVAQSEQGIPLEVQDLDSHPFLLNCRNGTLDLVTAELRNHRREDLLTRRVNVDYDAQASCPTWISFLNQILEPELIGYVQLALGYCLSGDTSQKAIFVAYGEPDAGKTTMLSTFRGILMEYSTLLQVQTLTGHGNTSNALADLADLRGARFAQTSECGGDERLAQKILKAITQGAGGRIKATQKYANPIQFDETCKIWIDTNPLPELADPNDQATLNRLKPIHFARTIPRDRIDRTLPDKLRAEFPGILAWLVKGFRLYQIHGLEKPPLVSASLAKWREACDNVQRFIDECCVVGPRFSIEPSPLYGAYLKWCGEVLEKAVPIQVFSTRMRHQKGCRQQRTNKRRFYSGIKLADWANSDTS